MAEDLTKQTPVDLTVPDFLKGKESVGTDHLTKDDIAMPRILLAQQMSPELTPGKPSYNENLHVGEMFNSLTGAIYGKGPLLFTVVRADKPRWVEFIPREQGGGIKDPDVKFGDPRTSFSVDGKPPIATKFYDFVIMLLPSQELVALSFKSTGLKVARQLNGLLQARQKPIYAGTYNLSSVPTQNAKGSFFIYQVRNVGWVTEEIYKIGENYYNALKGKTIELDRTVDQHEDGNGDASFDAVELERQATETGM